MRRRRRKKGEPKGTAHIPTTPRGIRRWWERWGYLWKTIGEVKQFNLRAKAAGIAIYKHGVFRQDVTAEGELIPYDWSKA